jgi:hypothetical protein
MTDDISGDAGKWKASVRGWHDAFKVTESIVGSKGVIIVNYERAGAITTGSEGA